MRDHYLLPILAEAKQAIRKKLWRDAFGHLLTILLIGSNEDTWIHDQEMYCDWNAFRSWSARLPASDLHRDAFRGVVPARPLGPAQDSPLGARPFLSTGSRGSPLHGKPSCSRATKISGCSTRTASRTGTTAAC